jgi:hypothetical protein
LVYLSGWNSDQKLEEDITLYSIATDCYEKTVIQCLWYPRLHHLAKVHESSKINEFQLNSGAYIIFLFWDFFSYAFSNFSTCILIIETLVICLFSIKVQPGANLLIAATFYVSPEAIDLFLIPFF